MRGEHMEKIQEVANRILTETGKIFVGKRDKTQLLLAGILAGGNILVDDIPGVGKTTLVKALAYTLGCGFKRVQFVSDLMPGDILGMNIFNQKTGEFELKEGPIHTNILLADEINRATARTQSALLEAMEERQTTIDGKRYSLPQPFHVIATQNPIEQENTFRLPIAQLDRFMMRLSLGYPTKEEEVKMLLESGDEIDFHQMDVVTSASELVELQTLVHQVHVSEGIAGYIVDLVTATRSIPEIAVGASPRAAKSLYKVSKAFAVLSGRDFVTPDDVQAMLYPTLNHRLLLSSPAQISNENIKRILIKVTEETEIRKA